MIHSYYVEEVADMRAAHLASLAAGAKPLAMAAVDLADSYLRPTDALASEDPEEPEAAPR